MVKRKSLVFWQVACCLIIFGLSAFAQTSEKGSMSILLEKGVTAEPPVCESPTIRVAANPSTVAYGQSSVVQWSVTAPPGCERIVVQFNGKSAAKSGSQTVFPSRGTRYTITVIMGNLGARFEKSASTQVSVNYPPRVVIDQNTAEPAAVLLGALNGASDRTVELCDVDIDLTRAQTIIMGDNTQLIASPDCARDGRKAGPRIFITDERPRGMPVLQIPGDGVRISGFRLEGPTSGIEPEKDIQNWGIYIFPAAGVSPVRSIEISNMEIYHWSGAGIMIEDNQDPNERGRLFNTNVGAIRIQNNYIHHNRHYGRNGYGVTLGDGAYALIEHNVFEANRHAIAGESRPREEGNFDYAGYTARENLLLDGGGEHSETWGTHTHQFDMHGDQNQWYSDNNWKCGIAGETLIFERNTFLYTKSHAIFVRGNPGDKAVADGNVFIRSRSESITQNGSCGFLNGDNVSNPIDVRPNNVFNFNPMSALGSCDFYGDGQLDQFMATGVTWWAKSPVTNQWRYLNTMPERLSQLRFGRFDGDAACDVAPRGRFPHVLPVEYSKGGTGRWTPLLVTLPNGP